MSTEANFLIVASVMMIVSLCFLIYVMIFRTVRREKRLWAFYKVRDELINLVGEGHLSEDSEVFRLYYPLVNRVINEVRPLRASEALHALKGASKNHRDQARVLLMLESQSPEVRVVIMDFYIAVFKAFITFSLLLKLLALTAWFRLVVRKRDFMFKLLNSNPFNFDIESMLVEIPIRRDLQGAFVNTCRWGRGMSR